jgi:hypothetical protein
MEANAVRCNLRSIYIDVKAELGARATNYDKETIRSFKYLTTYAKLDLIVVLRDSLFVVNSIGKIGSMIINLTRVISIDRSGQSQS